MNFFFDRDTGLFGYVIKIVSLDLKFSNTPVLDRLTISVSLDQRFVRYPRERN